MLTFQSVMSTLFINLINYVFMSERIQQTTPSIHTEIERLAGQAWERAGSPTGRDLEFWLAAENKLRQSNATPTATLSASPKTIPSPTSNKNTPSKKHRKSN
jgi:hypothetical protein